MAVLHTPSPASVIRKVPVGFAALLFFGCVKDAPIDSADSLPESLGRCDPESPPTWADVEPLFADHCTECHSTTNESSSRQGAPIGIDYDSAESSRLNSDLTWQMIVTERMPLKAPMPHEEALLVWDWLSCGGPE